MCYKIGIIGTDSSHALLFADLINNQKISDTLLVSHIWGKEEKETAAVLSEVKIENVLKNPFDMLGKVDAVLIVTRHGSNHFEYAEKFIRAGIPVWVDKPLTNNYETACALIRLANERDVPLMGGSAVRWTDGLMKAKKAVKESLGNIAFASLNFPADMDSQYDGFYFYASHLCEMAIEIFENEPISLFAKKISATNVTAILSYETFNVTLNFCADACKENIYIMGEKDLVLFDLDFSDAFQKEVRYIADVLSKKMIKKASIYDSFALGIKMIDMIYQSIENKREIPFILR